MMNDVELDFDLLLAPLASPARCGPSLLHDPVFDAIREARREDDASLPQGVWTAPLKRSDWAAVSRLCTHVLATRSKDVQVAAWLGEAWIALHGAAGGLRATRLLQGLCERYWEDLHPLPRNGDIEFRTMPLEWADVNWAAALLGRVVLVTGRDATGHTLRDWREALVADNDARKQDNAPALADAGSALIIESAAAMQADSLQQRLNDVAAWIGAIDALQVATKQRLQHNTPRFGQLRKTLQAAEDMVRRCLQAHPGAQSDIASIRDGMETGLVLDGEQLPGAAPDAGAVFRNREEVYLMLDRAAAHLMTIEPHSPVPALIRRAVLWGRMSFDDLLDELMKNDGEMQRMLYRINK